MAWVDVAAATDIADSYPIGFPKHLREDGRKAEPYYNYTCLLYTSPSPRD